MDTIHHVREVMQQGAIGNAASILREKRVMDVWTLPDFFFFDSLQSTSSWNGATHNYNVSSHFN